MYTELTKEERNSILGNENFKGTFVCCDSPICDYCARKHHPDSGFDDDTKCSDCIHGVKGAYYHNRRRLFADYFLGIQCIEFTDREEGESNEN